MRYLKRIKRRLKYKSKNLMVVMILAAVMGIIAAVQQPAATGTYEVSDQSASRNFSGIVSEVVDGDTFKMKGRSSRIRVWGLDAPEMNTYQGRAAAGTMRSLIGGQIMSCIEMDVDRYGRTVARCELPDGTDIARAMIAAGAAKEYCYFSRNTYGNC